jgi:hypothetical protein
MKKLLLLLNLTFMMTACIVEEEKQASDQGVVDMKNNVDPDQFDCSDVFIAELMCAYNEVRVESCDGLNDCRTENAICGGGSIHCQLLPYQCSAYPVCDEYSIEVPSCEGLSECYRNSICGTTIFCQIKPECVGFVFARDQGDDSSSGSSESGAFPGGSDSSSGAPIDQAEAPAGSAAGAAEPAPPPADLNTINVIAQCDPSNVSLAQCMDYEVMSDQCFIYQTEHPCFGTQIQFCRPTFSGDCAIDLRCKEGERQMNSCHLGQENCYTLNSCAGTIYCETPEITCSNAVAPENVPVVLDCDQGLLNSEPCSADEIVQNLCGAMIVPNNCMGSDLFYCHQAPVNCAAVPVCQDSQREVASCEGLANCEPVSMCGSTIYCETKPGCTDPNMGQDPVPTPAVMANRIDACQANELSTLPCDQNEVMNNLCFAYESANACDGSMVSYCRPQYTGACAFLVRCNDGDLEIDHCYLGDANCYTITGCAGTVFCQRP